MSLAPKKKNKEKKIFFYEIQFAKKLDHALFQFNNATIGADHEH